MPCYSPLTGWKAKKTNPGTGKRSIVFRKSEGFADLQIDVPCGQCTGCRLEYSRQWAIRCMHEAQMHEDNIFITLTYCDEKIPEYENLKKEHFQKFMKRLRKKYGKGIRYYACGEYGTKKNRPHYHACIFGLDFKDKELWTIRNNHKLYISKELDKLWTDPKDGVQYGWATIGEVTFETAAYVARYCMKKRKGKDKDAWYVKTDEVTGEEIDMQQEFSLMSRRPGIAKPWHDEFGESVHTRDSVILRGMEIKPPRYYDNIFDKQNPTQMADIKRARKKISKTHQHDNTLARLYIRGKCKDKKIELLKRSVEDENENVHSIR